MNSGNSNIRRSKRTSSGGVLAEFVIVMPLYIALISISIWLGMLALGRSRVLAAERYLVWGTGYRQSGKAGDKNYYRTQIVKTIYSDMAQLEGMSFMAGNGRQTHPGKASSKGTWSALNSAVCQATMKAPSWLHGPMSLLDLYSGKQVSDASPSVSLYAFGEEANRTQSLVLSRTKDSRRKFTSSNVGANILWQGVAREKYPSVSNDSQLSGLQKNCGSYSRDDEYWLWSE